MLPGLPLQLRSYTDSLFYDALRKASTLLLAIYNVLRLVPSAVPHLLLIVPMTADAVRPALHKGMRAPFVLEFDIVFFSHFLFSFTCQYHPEIYQSAEDDNGDPVDDVIL